MSEKTLVKMTFAMSDLNGHQATKVIIEDEVVTIVSNITLIFIIEEEGDEDEGQQLTLKEIEEQKKKEKELQQKRVTKH